MPAWALGCSGENADIGGDGDGFGDGYGDGGGDGGDGAGPSTKSNLVASVFCPDNEGHLDSSSGRGGLGGCVVAPILDGISNDDDDDDE